MPLHLDARALARLQRNLTSTEEPKPAPQPREKRERVPGPQPEGVPVWGTFGSRSHRWQKHRYADGGWEYVSVCKGPGYQMHGEPDGRRVNECLECLEEVSSE